MSMKPQTEGEIEDIPFLKNDLKEHGTTMGKPLDTADGPGKADAEIADEIHFDNGPAR